MINNINNSALQNVELNQEINKVVATGEVKTPEATEASVENQATEKAETQMPVEKSEPVSIPMRKEASSKTEPIESMLSEFFEPLFEKYSIKIEGAKFEPGQSEMERFKSYSFFEMAKNGIRFAQLKINRSLNQTQVKNKMVSLSKSGGSIMPILVVPAKKCFDENVAINFFGTNSEINRDDKMIGVTKPIVEGQHRHAAILKIYTKAMNDIKKETDEEKIKTILKTLPNCHYQLPLTDARIATQLHESNSVTKPWSGTDFLSSLILGNDLESKGIVDDMLNWVVSNRDKSGDTAAWLYATLDQSRVYSKTQLVKANSDEGLLKQIANNANFEYGKEIYEAVSGSLGENIAKLKCVPNWVIDKAKENPDVANSVKYKDIIQFFSSDELKVSKDVFKAFKNDKPDENDSKTKDQKIVSELTRLWNKFKKESTPKVA